MNDTYFIVVQLIGLEALILLVCSYFKRNTNQILVVQMLATICYALHYALLGAYSGFLICILELLRDFTYYKTNKDDYIFLFSIPIYVTFGLLTCRLFLDALPLGASLVDGYSLTKKKKWVVVGSIVSHILWIIYDYNVKSYSGVATCLVVIISDIYVLFFDKKKKSKRK